MAKTIAAIAADVEAGLTRELLQGKLPPGGARNALDCALWDLEAKASARPVCPQPLGRRLEGVVVFEDAEDAVGVGKAVELA